MEARTFFNHALSISPKRCQMPINTEHFLFLAMLLNSLLAQLPLAVLGVSIHGMFGDPADIQRGTCYLVCKVRGRMGGSTSHS